MLDASQRVMYEYSGMRNIATPDIPPSRPSPDRAVEAPEITLDRDVERFRQVLLALGRQHSLRDPLSSICEELDLTAAQINCLAWVGTEAVLTMGEISRRLGITEKSCTGIIDRLESAGFLKRERDLEDRRVVRVHLVEAGQRVFANIESTVMSKLRQMLAALDPPDRSTFCRILETLRERLASHALPRGEEP